MSEEFSLLKFDRYLSDVLSIKATSEGNVGIKSLRFFLKLLEYSGHGIPWIIATFYVICTNPNMETRLFFCNLLMALIIDLAVVGSLKILVRRRRPVYNVDDMFATVSIDRYSFPSGHTTRVVMVALLFTSYWKNRFDIRLGFIWAATVALSRVVLGRHHVSDVIGGAVIGYLQYCLVLKYWLTQEALEQIFNALLVNWIERLG